MRFVLLHTTCLRIVSRFRYETGYWNDRTGTVHVSLLLHTVAVDTCWHTLSSSWLWKNRYDAIPRYPTYPVHCGLRYTTVIGKFIRNFKSSSIIFSNEHVHKINKKWFGDLVMKFTIKRKTWHSINLWCLGGIVLKTPDK